ncbi:ABC transporter permease [Fontimonas sp. SYSU GA230001]|uniref:ABC transporter permease n=1 Tax=Fontimonas sp. SYSU GA230001 TaxID=3142450 RepID=UPI0032B42B1B
MTPFLRQIAAVTAMNVRSIPSRLGTSLVIVIGIAGVVGVMTALLSMAAGFQATLASTGRPDRVIVLRGGATDELSSVLYRDQGQIVVDLPGIRRGADGKPLASAELYMLTDVVKKSSGGASNVIVRGVARNVWQVRPEASIVAGRDLQPGRREVLVGRAAQAQFAGLELGDPVEVRDGPWQVVGVFEADGSAHESEIWVDVDTLHGAIPRQGYTGVTAQLDDDRPETFQAFKDRVTTDPRLTVQVQREPDFYASRSKALSNFINGLGYTVTVIMAIGAVFGALNTMYAAVSTRSVEIATLRALGFGGLPVVISVLIEALLLALAGGAIGAALAYLLFNGYSVSTLNFQTFSQTAFAFRVTPDLLVQGVTWAVLIGMIGGIFPAVRAARLPIVDALRAN